jgi:hypothetical protein
MRHRRFEVIGLGLIIGLLSLAQAEAAEVSTGPLRVNSGNEVVCIGANTGAANIASVSVVLWFRKADGTSNGNSPQPCGTLTASETCQSVAIGLGGDHAVFCEITAPAIAKIRGTLCNLSLGLCSNAD